MDADFIFNKNLQHRDFASLVELYTFFLKGQEENFDNWLKLTEHLSFKERLHQKQTAAYFLSEKTNLKLYRPTVSKNGDLMGGHYSFLASFLQGLICEFDIILT